MILYLVREVFELAEIAADPLPVGREPIKRRLDASFREALAAVDVGGDADMDRIPLKVDPGLVRRLALERKLGYARRRWQRELRRVQRALEFLKGAEGESRPPFSLWLARHITLYLAFRPKSDKQTCTLRPVPHPLYGRGGANHETAPTADQLLALFAVGPVRR